MLKYAYFVAWATENAIQIPFPTNKNWDPWKTGMPGPSPETPRKSLQRLGITVGNKGTTKPASQVDSRAEDQMFLSYEF